MSDKEMSVSIEFSECIMKAAIKMIPPGHAAPCLASTLVVEAYKAGVSKAELLERVGIFYDCALLGHSLVKAAAEAKVEANGSAAKEAGNDKT